MYTSTIGFLAAAILETAVLLVPSGSDQHEHGAHSPDVPQQAVAVLMPTQGNNVRGTLLLTQHDGYMQVTGKVRGLSPGEHGFHIHEFGDLRDPAGKSAGGHYNPKGAKHGGPDDKERHPGDLGNITANAEGVAEVNKKADGLKLHFVLGRSFVVHAGKDDLKSQPSGDAGPRVAVGVIGFAEVKSAK